MEQVAEQRAARTDRGESPESDLLESRVRSYSRLFAGVFAHAAGASVFDQHDRRYFDFLSGAGVHSYGHNNPHIKQALLDYLAADGIGSSLDLHTTARGAFLRAFQDVVLVPRGLDYRVQCCGPTGADAVEAALKLARKATGRSSILAFTNAYHGVTLGALAATAGAHERAAAGLALEGVLRAPFEGFGRQHIDTILLLEDMLGPGGGVDLPAAIIVETVQAEGGLNLASVTWLRRLATLARERGVLLIVDDIQVGCGRTGRFFSFERAGITPDIVCLSKAIGGGQPMALVLMRPELDVWAPGEHVGTFRGNNLAFVAATAALDFWRSPDLEREIEHLSRLMHDRLEAIVARHRAYCVETRGIGMIQGLVFRPPELAKRVSAAAFARGLIAECAGAKGQVLKLLPPLLIAERELEEALDLLAGAVEEVMALEAALPAAS
jgi:diaminobutyrate-2-oxoglutarate transaminase